MMPFPDVERVIYKKNPLIQVVCQLRFPRILVINERAPVDFQERIRKDYPIYKAGVEQQQEIIVEPGVDPSPKLIKNEQRSIYSFTSDDGVWEVNLTSTFLSLTTSHYTQWEDFCSQLKEPLSALYDIYRPAFFERVGLRYVDAFYRSYLNSEMIPPWAELINPFALGILSNPDIEPEIKGYYAISEIDLDQGAMARIITSTGFVGNAMEQQDSELSFIVDSDLFFHAKKQLDELGDSLNYLHEYAGRIIRNIITDKLHKAMGPEEI